MIQNKKQITTPYFDERVNNWVYRGFTFYSQKDQFEFLMVLELFGSATNDPEIQQRWKIFKISEDQKMECLTLNGVQTDASFLKNNSDGAASKRKGLSIEDIIKLEKYAHENVLSRNDLDDAVIAEIQPALIEATLLIKNKIANIENLKISELVLLAKEISKVSRKIKNFFPRSYEKFLEMQLTVRETYAKKKYPDLYNELKKYFDDSKYKADQNDIEVGFGLRLIYEGLYYRNFKSTGTERTWELHSPFEKQFGQAVLFI